MDLKEKCKFNRYARAITMTNVLVWSEKLQSRWYLLWYHPRCGEEEVIELVQTNLVYIWFITSISWDLWIKSLTSNWSRVNQTTLSCGWTKSSQATALLAYSQWLCNNKKPDFPSDRICESILRWNVKCVANDSGAWTRRTFVRLVLIFSFGF